MAASCLRLPTEKGAVTMGLVNLGGKVALVTGGGHGLGAGICEAIGQAGASVLVTDLDYEGAKNVASHLKEQGVKALPLKVDVTCEEEFQKAIQAGCEEFGRVDILVNNAGIVKIRKVLELPLSEWDKVFDVNVRALLRCSQVFAEHLINQGRGGSIVNTASNAGKVGYIGQIHYNASKAAVISMTQSLAKELAEFNINVNAVCPGAVDTEMLHECMLWTIEESKDTTTVEELRKMWAPVQLGRLIKPIEVGRVVAFLASDAAIVIRGQSINVDAGTTAW
jgi:NAD(P)-dependent dehydrogenase (short-subunit alcohol dehydrogenase family)